jgi:aryl-alcohol dehydrogenase-like predicted oxidoreductase
MELSSLGMGTYLGPADEVGDAGYAEAARAFAAFGGNVFDTAANYRSGRSERALGRVLPQLPRESFFVSTKAGYLPMGDGFTEEPARDWFERTLLRPGILNATDVVDGCHALTPRYLEYQLGRSLEALGLASVDLFHLHNPEQQRPSLGPEAFRAVLRRAFEACEGFVQAGRIGAYGCATWNGFRVPPHAPEHLSLEELVGLAREVAGEHHHFRWVQLPLNLALTEALLLPTQRWAGQALTLLQAAEASGIRVQTSASIMQAKILAQLPTEFIGGMGVETAAQAALQFTRSCPGVTTALCGMGQTKHVRENARLLALPKLDAASVAAVFA